MPVSLRASKTSTLRTLNKAHVVALLRTHKAHLREHFGVEELALFGSYARDHATESSDVDVLVGFDSPPDWQRYFGAQAYLEGLFGRPVDLAINPAYSRRSGEKVGASADLQ